MPLDVDRSFVVRSLVSISIDLRTGRALFFSGSNLPEHKLNTTTERESLSRRRAERARGSSRERHARDAIELVGKKSEFFSLFRNSQSSPPFATSYLLPRSRSPLPLQYLPCRTVTVTYLGSRQARSSRCFSYAGGPRLALFQRVLPAASAQAAARLSQFLKRACLCSHTCPPTTKKKTEFEEEEGGGARVHAVLLLRAGKREREREREREVESGG